jgi:hypothetical protein
MAKPIPDDPPVIITTLPFNIELLKQKTILPKFTLTVVANIHKTIQELKLNENHIIFFLKKADICNSFGTEVQH